MSIKYWFLKKNYMVPKNHLNSLFDTMIMMIRPLCIKLPQIIGYVKSFENSMTMSFKVSDKQLLKKYNNKQINIKKQIAPL